jgi:hypothetical protein
MYLDNGAICQIFTLKWIEQYVEVNTRESLRQDRIAGRTLSVALLTFPHPLNCVPVSVQGLMPALFCSPAVLADYMRGEGSLINHSIQHANNSYLGRNHRRPGEIPNEVPTLIQRNGSAQRNYFFSSSDKGDKLVDTPTFCSPAGTCLEVSLSRTRQHQGVARVTPPAGGRANQLAPAETAPPQAPQALPARTQGAPAQRLPPLAPMQPQPPAQPPVMQPPAIGRLTAADGLTVLPPFVGNPIGEQPMLSFYTHCRDICREINYLSIKHHRCAPLRAATDVSAGDCAGVAGMYRYRYAELYCECRTTRCFES